MHNVYLSQILFLHSPVQFNRADILARKKFRIDFRPLWLTHMRNAPILLLTAQFRPIGTDIYYTNIHIYILNQKSLITFQNMSFNLFSLMASFHVA